MTTQQPEALRPIDAAYQQGYAAGTAGQQHYISAIETELSRLHAENEDHIQQLRKEQLEVERLHHMMRAAVAAERERLLSTEIHSCHADCQRFACVQTRRAVEAEREKVAVWMIERSYATGHGDTTEDLLKELEWQVRESEREACAKLCDEMERRAEGTECCKWPTPADCAYAIRARGEKI